MAKIKDTIEDDKEFANQELASQESMQGYFFDSTKHIHLLDGKPLIGTSSMASVLAKPLTWWASGLACAKFGWINKKDENGKFRTLDERLQTAFKMWKKISGMSNEEYLDLLDDAYKAHSVKLSSSAEAGTDMHSVMEEYVKYCIEKNEGLPFAGYKSSFVNVSDSNKEKLQILVDWSVQKVKRFIGSEDNCYSRVLWLGGVVDCVYEDMDGKYVILDFKSSKEVYLSQFWQAVGYAIQLEENGAFTSDGVLKYKLDKPISYVAVLPFGMKEPEVFYNEDMSGGKDAVVSMLTLYKKLN